MNAKLRNLEERRGTAAAGWQELQQSPRPVIYIGAASCGLAAGAGESRDAVSGYLERKGIDARIVPVGCIGPCYLEPLVDVQMPGRPRVSYSNSAPRTCRRSSTPSSKSAKFRRTISPGTSATRA